MPYASPQPWCPPCFAHRPPTRPARPPTRPHHTQRSLQGAYNAILAGAAFMDSVTAFAAYSSPDTAPCRGMVDRLRNCDDLLLNFVVANASLAAGRGAGPAPVRFVRPRRRLDISRLSGVGACRVGWLEWSRGVGRGHECLCAR